MLDLISIRKVVLLATLGVGASASLAQPQPVSAPSTEQTEAERIEQITARMRDNVQRLPNYTCTETIERTTTAPDGQILTEDTVHLEVALIDNNEMFAWPGSTEFDDSGLDDLVAGGGFGSGAFGLYTKVLFLNQNRPTLRPRGRVNLDDLERGDGLIQYDFTVPRSKNEFRINEGPLSAVVGFEGSIYVDPETLDLRRMEVVLMEIPPQLALVGASDQVNYDRVQFGEDRFLLPVSNRLTMQNPGRESQNRVRFEKCHKFEGESTISFEDPALLEDTEQEVVQEVAIPPDTSLHMVMDFKRKADEVAVGDLVIGKLRDPVQIDGKELIPKGAKVSARVVRMDRTPDWYALSLRVTDIDWKGKHARMDGYIDRLPAAEAERDPFKRMFLATPPVEDSGAVARQPSIIMIPRPGTKSIREILTDWRTFSDTPRVQAPASPAASPGSTVSDAGQEAFPEVAIPPDTSVHMVLDFQRTPDQMEVGDLVTGKLTDPVQVDGKELIPKGATVSARVVRMDGNSDWYGLGLRVTDIDWKGKHARMAGYIERLPGAEAENDPRKRMVLETPEVETWGAVAQEPSTILIPRLEAKSIRELLTNWRTFSDTPRGESTASPASTVSDTEHEVTIPPDTSVHIVLDFQRTPDEVVVGDLVTGKLSEPVQVDGKELIPQGANVSARVIRMDGDPDWYKLRLRAEDIDWKGKHARMDGYIERLPASETERDPRKRVVLESPKVENSGAVAQEPSTILIPRLEAKSIREIPSDWRTFSDTPRGESSASPGSTVSDTEPEAIQEVTIPPDTSLHIVMDFQRTPDKMELGDLVTGKLSDAVQVDGKELIPKGAKISARVVTMDRNPYVYGLSLRVTDIDWKGKHAKMYGYIERLPAAEAERDPLRRMSLVTVQIENSDAVPQASVIMIPPLAAKSIRELLTYWKTF